MESGVHVVLTRSASSPDTLGSEGHTRCSVSFVPVLKANLKAGPLAQTFRACPDTAPQPTRYAQGRRKPPLCSCFPPGRDETVL